MTTPTHTLPEFAQTSINLASARIGAEVTYATDDFFAPKERMLLDSQPIANDEFTDRGKWMDGWESRRRREPGNDYAIVRLGAKGVLYGVDVDTRHFTGNYPPSVSVEGTDAADPMNPDTEWTVIVPRDEISGNSHNYIPIVSHKAFTYVRLQIYPDGGVARFRVYGMPVIDWSSRSKDEVVELSAIKNGGRVLAYNDAHYGDPWAILAPGRGINMGDGWETRRRREPGNDWIVVALGAAGIVERVEVDTAHFKGNYPDRCSVEAIPADRFVDEADIVGGSAHWQTLMEPHKLEMNRIHVFGTEQLLKSGPVSHIRLSIYPDGGISRFRVFGRVTAKV